MKGLHNADNNKIVPLLGLISFHISYVGGIQNSCFAWRLQSSLSVRD